MALVHHCTSLVLFNGTVSNTEMVRALTWLDAYYSSHSFFDLNWNGLIWEVKLHFQLCGGNMYMSTTISAYYWVSLTSITSSLHAVSPLSTYHYARWEHTSSSLSLWEFTPQQYHTKVFPWLIGHWHTQDATHEELYSASLLALFKPWKALADLDTPGMSFQDSLAAFLASDCCTCKDQVDNIRYIHSMVFLSHNNTFTSLVFFDMFIVTYLHPVICPVLSDSLMW